MFKTRNVKYYARIIAKEHGVSIRQANALLAFAWKNITQMMERKEDIRLTGIGRIYLKKPYRKRKKP